MMDSEWRDAPFNESDSYIDEEPTPDPSLKGREIKKASPQPSPEGKGEEKANYKEQ